MQNSTTKKQKLVKFVQFPLIQHIKTMPISVLQLFKGFSKRILQLFKRFLWWISQLFKGFLVKSGDFYCGWWGLAVGRRFVGFLVAELASGGFIAAGAGAFARFLVSPHTSCRQPHCQQHQYQYNPTLYVHCFKIH